MVIILLYIENNIYILIMFNGQASAQSLQRVHLSELIVMAPPNISIAFSLQTNKHGAWDGGWQFIQNKVGVSTFGVC
jgi:hypothetical protein